MDWDEVIDFSNDCLTLRLLVAIALRMPRADLLEALRKWLGEVSRARPYLVENAERTAKLIKLFCMAHKGIGVCKG